MTDLTNLDPRAGGGLTVGRKHGQIHLAFAGLLRSVAYHVAPIPDLLGGDVVDIEAHAGLWALDVEVQRRQRLLDAQGEGAGQRGPTVAVYGGPCDTMILGGGSGRVRLATVMAASSLVLFCSLTQAEKR